MACFNLSTGIASSCDTSRGGIKKAYILDGDAVTFEVGTDTNADKINTITGATTSNTFLFEFRKGTSSLTTTLTTDPANGVLYYSNALMMQFSKMESSKRLAINALAKSKVKAVVVDANGKWWGLGFDESMEVSEGNSQTGVAASDGNYYNITLTDESLDLPMELTATAQATIEALFD